MEVQRGTTGKAMQDGREGDGVTCSSVNCFLPLPQLTPLRGQEGPGVALQLDIGDRFLPWDDAGGERMRGCLERLS